MSYQHRLEELGFTRDCFEWDLGVPSSCL